jgi:hypothetical protein
LWFVSYRAPPRHHTYRSHKHQVSEEAIDYQLKSPPRLKQKSGMESPFLISPKAGIASVRAAGWIQNKRIFSPLLDSLRGQTQGMSLPLEPRGHMVAVMRRIEMCRLAGSNGPVGSTRSEDEVSHKQETSYVRITGKVSALIHSLFIQQER